MLIIQRIGGLTALCHAVKGRLCKIQAALFNQLWHLAIEIGHQQGGDMGAIHIRICHNNHLAIAQIIQREILAALHP